jgi:hypothetical protein
VFQILGGRRAKTHGKITTHEKGLFVKQVLLILSCLSFAVQCWWEAVKKKRQEIDAGEKLVAVHYVLHKKHSKHDTIRKMATEYHINTQHIELARWIRDVEKIHQAWTKRIPGGGTMRLGVRNGTESATLTWCEERRARGERTRFIDIRRELGTRDKAVKVFAVVSKNCAWSGRY